MDVSNLLHSHDVTSVCMHGKIKKKFCSTRYYRSLERKKKKSYSVQVHENFFTSFNFTTLWEKKKKKKWITWVNIDWKISITSNVKFAYNGYQLNNSIGTPNMRSWIE